MLKRCLMRHSRTCVVEERISKPGALVMTNSPPACSGYIGFALLEKRE